MDAESFRIQGPDAIGIDELWRDHDILGAHQNYLSATAANPTSGDAAAGAAMTWLMLLPCSEEVDALLIQGLGARHGFGRNCGLFYGEGGVLQLLTYGFPTDEIWQTLENDLPWSSERMETRELFVAGLNRPVSLTITDHLIAIANKLDEPIEQIEIALQDPDFHYIHIPSEVFFDPSLSLFLGKSELALIQSALRTLQGAMLFFSGYNHAWSLEEAFGSQWRIVADDPGDERHQPGFAPIDYSIAYLDAAIGREIKDGSLLSRQSQPSAKISIRKAAAALRRAILEGMNQKEDRQIPWNRIGKRLALQYDDILAAVELSLDDQATLPPFIDPATTLDLRLIFSGDGRILPEATTWLVSKPEDGGEGVVWNWNPRAIEKAFIDGVFTPPFAYEEPPTIDWESNETEALSETIRLLFDDLKADIENAYLTTN
jgi:hypothetical protein